MDVRAKTSDLTEAHRKIFDGRIALWNTRLEAILDTGDTRAIIEHLKSDISDANNCGCNNGCDALARDGGAIGR